MKKNLRGFGSFASFFFFFALSKAAFRKMPRGKLRGCPALPPGFGDDHLGTQLMELVPELFGLQAAGDFGHLLAGDDGGGGDEGLGAQGRRAAAKIPVRIQAG